MITNLPAHINQILEATISGHSRSSTAADLQGPFFQASIEEEDIAETLQQFIHYLPKDVSLYNIFKSFGWDENRKSFHHKVNRKEFLDRLCEAYCFDKQNLESVFQGCAGLFSPLTDSKSLNGSANHKSNKKTRYIQPKFKSESNDSMGAAEDQFSELKENFAKTFYDSKLNMYSNPGDIGLLAASNGENGYFNSLDPFGEHDESAGNRETALLSMWMSPKIKTTTNIQIKDEHQPNPNNTHHQDNNTTNPNSNTNPWKKLKFDQSRATTTTTKPQDNTNNEDDDDLEMEDEDSSHQHSQSVAGHSNVSRHDSGMGDVKTPQKRIGDGMLSDPSPQTFGSDVSGNIWSSPAPTTSTSKGRSKGLRYLSVRVKELVREKGETSYKEVADIMIREILSAEGGFDDHNDNGAGVGLSHKHKNEKNIRRRVYDALNVLIAADILVRVGKKVRCPDRPMSTGNPELDEKRQLFTTLTNAVKEKNHELHLLSCKVLAADKLIKRNQKRRDHEDEKIYFPFLVVSTPDDDQNEIDIKVNKTRTQLKLDCSQPFQVYGDVDILLNMGFHNSTSIGSNGGAAGGHQDDEGDEKLEEA